MRARMYPPCEPIARGQGGNQSPGGNHTSRTISRTNGWVKLRRVRVARRIVTLCVVTASSLVTRIKPRS
eukprot:9065913-Pyramimonas_sp.AAC.1